MRLPLLGLLPLLLAPAASAGVSIDASLLSSTWSVDYPVFVAFSVKADCQTVLREAAENPLFNEPEFRVDVQWPFPGSDGPWSGEYRSIDMQQCLLGAEETLGHPFIFVWESSSLVPSLVPLEAVIHASVVATDIQALGPNPSAQHRWNVTVLPHVDRTSSYAFVNGTAYGPEMGPDGVMLRATGAILANHDLDMTLEARGHGWQPYCWYPFGELGAFRAGAPVRVPRTSVAYEASPFDLAAFLEPPPAPLRSSDGCYAEQLLGVAVVARLAGANATAPPLWEQVIEFPVRYATEPFEPSSQPVDARNGIPGIHPLVPLLAALAAIAARRTGFP